MGGFKNVTKVVRKFWVVHDMCRIALTHKATIDGLRSLFQPSAHVQTALFNLSNFSHLSSVLLKSWVSWYSKGEGVQKISISMCKMGRGLVTLKKKYKNGGKGVKNLQFGAKECFEYPCFSNKVASVVVTGVYRHIHIPFIS